MSGPSTENLKAMLSQARFYGAKSSEIDWVEVVREAPALGHRHVVAQVHHGKQRALYQLLLDATDRDVLATSATSLGQALSTGTPAGFGELHGTAAELIGLEGRVHEGEQSNTSLIFGDEVMVKYFRKLEPGPNPDVELLRAISDCPHIAPVSGWVTADIQGSEYVLAMIQRFIPEALDGWTYALGFTRINASFAPEATLIGEATRAVHTALAAAFPVMEVEISDLVPELEARLDHLISRAPVLAEFETAARAFYRNLDSGTTLAQRIHGDLHLGQVLRTEDSYVLIDFEGEPDRPLPQRRLPDSPLRDLAGLLRSLDYAAHVGEDSAEWVEAASAALLTGYGVPGLSSSKLLDAYILDKALYEVAYETDHRPDWVDIPLRAVQRLLK
ncbi:phosphotransferase [Corynebacterium sp. A21]|uniref:phosphotransferase n=1 Tax=Corynebacterium sp. A21 TaxID=3457318 RepID=UPI003FD1348F